MAKYPNSGALTAGLILTALGAIFLAENFYAPFSAWELVARYWPVCLVVIGLSKLCAWLLRPGTDAASPAPAGRRPSLLGALLWTGLGVLFLLGNLGIAPDAWTVTRRYWPVLLIFLGAGKVIDYFLRKSSVSLRFGEFFSLLAIFILGIVLTGKPDMQLRWFLSELPFRIGNVSVQPEQWLGNSHTYKEEAVYSLEGAGRIRIENFHGSVSIAPGSDLQIRVRLNKVIYADEPRARDLAGKIRLEGSAEPPGSISSGPGDPAAVFAVKTNRGSVDAGNSRIDTDMEVFVPKSSQLHVRNSFGALRVAGIDGNLDLGTTHRSLEVLDCKGRFVVSSSHGECRLFNLTGDLELQSRNSVYLENIRGDVRVANEFSPTVISRVDGKVTVKVAEGDLRIEDVSQPVAVDARGTDVYAARLQGAVKISAGHGSVRVEDAASDLSLESRYANIYLKGIGGDVRIQSESGSIQADAVGGNLAMNGRASGIRLHGAGGRVNIRTTLKDVVVGGVSGYCSIENEYAGVRLSLSGPLQDDVNIKNRNGGIDLFLPEGADFSLSAVARRGRVESFYGGLAPGATGGTLEYNADSAGAAIRLVTEYDTIRIFGGGETDKNP